ncbi:MAG: pyridoxal phosphate-dependent decarboxylase family protein [Ignavibacteria bacterium]
MDISEFKLYAYQLINWIAEYYANIEEYPVRSPLKPGDVINQLPKEAPQKAQPFEAIMSDFEKVILPGITHWQSPNFFAYFPANASFPSILAEMLTAALGVQGMKWETSPAAAELEEQVLNWIKKAFHLPTRFEGVIQDTASTSTLVAILTAREKLFNFESNKSGLFDKQRLRVYCSTEAHSSVEKAVKVAGIGNENLVKIRVDKNFRMKPDELDEQIRKDKEHGYSPLCVVAALGTTGCTAIDPLEEIAKVCEKHNLWLHVDAAYGGSALILPEYRWMIKGIEHVNSFVFNPHKWMFTNFDCSVYFVQDKNDLIKTFEIIPEYLKTRVDSKVNNYCDWGIQLGRRFRALKLWFVLRAYGLKGISEKLRYHIKLAEMFETELIKDGHFDLMAPRTMNLVCFRYRPDTLPESKLNDLNQRILQKINDSGKIYLSHTKLNGKYTLRFVCGQTNVNEDNIRRALEIIKQTCITEAAEVS